MKKLLAILFIFPLVVKSQTTTDSVVINNTTIKYTVTYSTSAYVDGDSIYLKSTSTKKRGLVSPLSLPISTATQTALNLKANLISPVFTTPNIGSAIGSISGNAGTATALQNSRTIGGTSFDGTANITVATATGGFTVSGGNLALGTNSVTMSGSIGVTGTRVTKGWFTDGEFTNMPTVGGTALSTTFQASNAKLTAIAALANGSGYLKNNGSGTFTYETPAGAGTVTNTGNLTSNAIVLGNGTTDTKVVTGITSDGTAQLVLGVNTTTLGTVKMFGNTSGDATIQPAAVAGTATVITLPNVTSTLLPNTTTSGVAASPTASSTVTITHNLGRIPTTIRIYSISSFTSNAAATPVPFSMGVFNSSGNRCVYMVINGTTTQVSQTSTVFSIIMVTSAGNSISGVIGNVGATTFDIVFTETGTHTAGNYLWEAQ